MQEEEEDLSGFMHGGEATSGMRGAKAGSESDGADSIEQRWRDIEGTPSFSEDHLASEGGAGRMVRAPFSRNISTLSHLGSSDSLNRIVAEVSARVFLQKGEHAHGLGAGAPCAARRTFGTLRLMLSPARRAN